MDDKIFRKSLIRCISVMADVNDTGHPYSHEKKEQRIRAMMQTYLAVSP